MQLDFIIIDEKSRTIGTYLAMQQHFSRKLLKKVRYHGEIWHNQKRARLTDVLISGDELQVIFPEETISDTLIPVAKPLEIIFEDDWVLVVNKPAGLLSVPSPKDNRDSLAQRILAHYQVNGLTTTTVHVVTRLDRGTCGLLLVAKNHFAKQQLTQQKIKRHYYALVQGVVEQNQGQLTMPIARGEGIKRMCCADGQAADTSYRILARDFDQMQSFVHVELGTGRTHQIRVHMAEIGHPLVGDYLYGNAAETQLPRLQSYFLAFTHPQTKVDYEFKLPCAARIQR